eukprot:4885272-Amphidinium_carterae.1
MGCPSPPSDSGPPLGVCRICSRPLATSSSLVLLGVSRDLGGKKTFAKASDIGNSAHHRALTAGGGRHPGADRGEHGRRVC